MTAKIILLLKTGNRYKKFLPLIICSFLVISGGLYNYFKIEKVTIDQIPPQILPILQEVSKIKGINILDLATEARRRSNFGRIDLSQYHSNALPSNVFSFIKFNLFETYNIFNLSNFSVERFTFSKGDYGLFGVMLLSGQDIQKYGSIDPFSYKEALLMLAEKLNNEKSTLLIGNDLRPRSLPTCCIITQRFMQTYPDSVQKTLGPNIPRYHTGLDIADTPAHLTYVYSTLNGVATRGEDNCGGKYVVIENSFYKTYYGHLDEVFINAHEAIKIGDVIGIQGHTGFCSTGKHTHYEVYEKGKLVDPLSFN